jgi:hypothetical protein
MKMPSKIHAVNLEYDDPQYKTKPQDVTVLGADGRLYQIDVYSLFEDERFCRLIAPCGSGKSTVQVALAIGDVVNSNLQRLQVFVVPQSHIAFGFFARNGGVKRIQIHGNVFEVSVSDQPNHHFCDKSSVSELKDILVNRPKLSKLCKGNRLTGLFVTVTNAALVQAWEQMTPMERKKAIHNVHFRIDESHHVLTGGISEKAAAVLTPEQIEDAQTNNQLGTFCKYVLKSSDKTARMTFSTATDFRGDSHSPISSEFDNLFTNYKLDWLEHWKTIGIKDLYVLFNLFKNDPIKTLVSHICKEKKEKHYVVIPPMNSGWRKGLSKDEAVTIIVKALKKKWANVRVLDLVTEATQDANKKLLLDEPKDGVTGDSRKSSQYDVVLTCMLGREGTDWVPCSRLHVTYAEGSITLAVQTIGRLLRRYTSVEGKAKTLAIARYYLPSFPKPKNGMSKDELLDTRKNVLFIMMQCEELFYPILYPNVPRKKGKKGTGKGAGAHYGSLEDPIGCTEYRALKEEFLETMEDLEIAEMLTQKSMMDTITSLLHNYGVSKKSLHYKDAVHTLIIFWARRLDPSFVGVMDIAFLREMGFPALYEKMTKEGRTLMASYGLNVGKALRALLQKAWDKNIATIKKLRATGKLKTEGDFKNYPKLRAWAFAYDRYLEKKHGL